MLKKMNRYIGHAYSVANAELKSSVEVEEGTWITIDTDGKLIVSDGTKKSFMLTGSQRTGRDYTANGLFKGVSFIHGPFYGMNTSIFDATKDYPPMTPLMIGANGILTPFVAATPPALDKAVVAYAIKKISATELEILSA